MCGDGLAKAIDGLLVDYQLAVGRWAEWATEIVEGWPDDISQSEPDPEILRSLSEASDAFAARYERTS